MSLVRQVHCKEGNTCSAVPLEKRKVIKKTLQRAIGFIIIFFCFVVGLLSAAPASYSWTLFVYIAIPLIAILAIYIFQCLYYRYYFYNLLEEDIVIKKGVVSRREITLLYSKIQSVYIDQDFFDRIFKLYDVHVETAGFGSGVSAHIDGVNHANSEKLRNLISEKVKKYNNRSI